jgi:hypothetical protein
LKDRYETFKNIKVGVMTWNLGGKKPREDFDIKNIILS